MANVTVRNQTENKPAPAPTAAIAREPRWEPLRLMRDLMGWDPFREMSPFLPQTQAAFNPSFEIKETKDEYQFKADVPGVKESDLAVSVTGNRLTISGKREAEKEEKNDTFYTYERSYGDFMRSFTLPDGVDTNGIHADLKDGVLTLLVKKLPAAQTKTVTVQTAAKKS